MQCGESPFRLLSPVDASSLEYEDNAAEHGKEQA